MDESWTVTARNFHGREFPCWLARCRRSNKLGTREDLAFVEIVCPSRVTTCRWANRVVGTNRSVIEGGGGESIPKSIETTTKLSLIFLEIVGFAARKGGGKRTGIFLDFFFVDFDGRIENSFGNCLLNAVSMQVPVNFYKLKFRPWNFIDSKRLSRRPSLDLVWLVAYLFHSRALLLSVAFLYVRPTAMQKLDCEKVATLFKITFISTRITFPLKNIIIRVALFLISNPVKILSNSAAIFRLRFIRDTLICFMINNITTFVRKYIYI